jgi:hypothetical protein
MRGMKRRFLDWCRWLQWSAWEFGRGIDIDQDGGIDGSGFLFRLEPPRWLKAWARRWIPPPTEREMLLHRQDISDVLLESLMRGSALGLLNVRPGLTGPELVWTEDQL